jgi:hypothetical protein
MSVSNTNYKLLRHDMTHNGIIYKEGKNIFPNPVDINLFNSGLYFSDIYNVFKSLEQYLDVNKTTFICRVVVADSHMIVLKDIMPLDMFFDVNPKFRLIAVKQNGYCLKFIKEQSTEICIAAISQHYYAMKYIKDLVTFFKQNPIYRIIAVRDNGMMLQYIQNQTPEICSIAVKQNPDALQFIKI